MKGRALGAQFKVQAKQDRKEIHHNDDSSHEIITPYVILNKIDIGISVFRLQKKKKGPKALGSRSQIEESQVSDAEGAAVSTVQPSTQTQSSKMQNIYKIKQGQIVDYMVDYNEEERQLIFDERIQRYYEDLE